MKGHAQKMEQNRDDVAASDLTSLCFFFFHWMALNSFFSLLKNRPSSRFIISRGLAFMNRHTQNIKQSGDDVAAPDLSSFHFLPFHQPTLDRCERNRTAEGTTTLIRGRRS